MVSSHFQQWKRDIFSRTEAANESLPEKFGDYFYYSQSIRARDGESFYGFFRKHVDGGAAEKVLDLRDVRHIRNPTTTFIDKIKISDDHTRVAFNVDINNNEKLSLGIMDIKTSKVLDWIPNANQAEFDSSGDNKFSKSSKHICEFSESI